jgi:hypothetical protein
VLCTLLQMIMKLLQILIQKATDKFYLVGELINTELENELYHLPQAKGLVHCSPHAKCVSLLGLT